MKIDFWEIYDNWVKEEYRKARDEYFYGEDEYNESKN